MITRAEYREQMIEREKVNSSRRETGVLTDAEFKRMPVSKQMNYALKQKQRGLPVTVEQDTYYDTEKARTHYEPTPIFSNKKAGFGIGVALMAFLTKIDIIASFCGVGKN